MSEGTSPTLAAADALDPPGVRGLLDVPEPFAPFAAALPFALAPYQRQALQALASPGVSLVVVAPTGSGKTVVADAAIWHALQAGAGVAYTSPLRALANQRFAQLTQQHGARTGLLTGDTVIRPNAPVRVMTAEVYRTIALLPGEVDRPSDSVEGAPVSGGLASSPPPLAWAIFDEAHYMADQERGSAWEEAILATPAQTRILCLSATIGAPERLAGWLRWLGREVSLIHTSERPVPLRHYLSLRGNLHLVLDERGQRAATFPFAGGWALAARQSRQPRRGPGPRGRPAPIAGLPQAAPDDWTRTEAIAALRLMRERDLVPAIAFTASRREAERLAEAARAAFPEVASGVAHHHAGLRAQERRAVEERLRAGGLWLVCGTTTLAAGLDVPARSVLLTTFGRFDGRAYTLFSPAEYRQLTGRAGRLGKDQAGAAVLLPSPWHAFEEAFRALTTLLPPIASAFRPAYATALAWWGGGQPGDGDAQREARLARALASTFAAFLRHWRANRQAAPPPLDAPDDASRHLARALGRLLAADGLVVPGGALTARGRFVLHVAGGPEGRLLLRLLEAGAFEALPDGLVRVALLALLAEGGALPPDAPGTAVALPVYHAGLSAQVAAEREAGALLTSPRSTQAPPPRSFDAWRAQAAAADLLERGLRAARQAGMPDLLGAWAPALLAQLTDVR